VLPSTAHSVSAQFWRVFRRSSLPMFVLDGDAVYVDANDAACRAVHLARDDFVGRQLGFGTDRERLPEVARMWAQLVRRGQLVVPYEFDSPSLGQMRINIACFADTPEPGYQTAVYWPQTSRARGDEHLTPREREITQLLALGLTGEQIARNLKISPETARTHIRNAMEHLDARTRAQLVARAIAAGIIASDTGPASVVPPDARRR
jgi:DNA-binding CsgD family transcriptional regulator